MDCQEGGPRGRGFHAHRVACLDFLETAAGNDFEELELARHMGARTSGGSNCAFADGSARYLRYGQSVSPLNLWAITDAWRMNAATGF